MRLLVDRNLPPRLAQQLTDAGHDAVHVRDLGIASAPDPQILERAVQESRVARVLLDLDRGRQLGLDPPIRGVVTPRTLTPVSVSLVNQSRRCSDFDRCQVSSFSR